MDSVKELFAQDFSATIISLLIIMSGIITIGKIISDFAKIVAKPVSKIKQQQDDHKLLADAIQNLEELHKIHDEDMKATNGQDELIRQDLHALTITVNEIIERLDIMQSKIDSTEMIKLKEKILAYYRKYSPLGEWEQFESDVFWGLYDSYISHGGNSFVIDDIEPAMRQLKIKN